MFTYPPARRVDIVDDYHGTPVPDPYRWLEDPDSDETKAFVAAENALTLSYLHGMPERQALRERIAALWDLPRTEAPQRRAGVTVWAHNDGLADQPTYLVEADGERRVLLDPNTLSDDGTVAVVVSSLSDDGRHFAYTLADAGSDWQTLRIRDVATGDDLPEVLRFVKFTSVAWHDDGFFYSRFPEQDPTSTEPSRNQSVWFHRLGTDQADDAMVWANPERPDLGYAPEVSGAYLVLTEWEGTSHNNGLLYRRLDRDDTWMRLFDTGVALHGFVAADDGGFLLHTDRDAPNGRVVRIDLDDPETFHDVVPEGDPIETVTAASGRLAVTRLVDAAHRVELYAFDGEPDGEVPLPGLVTVSAVSGHIDEPDIFIGYQSFAVPPSVVAWNGGVVTAFAETDPPLGELVVERLTTVSTDGAQVGMFVVRLSDTALPAPTELYGYGGFAINVTPMFDPARLAFLEAGGQVVVANLRGGLEQGESWHQQGMLERKQQVFDDFIACAEQLIADGYATTSTLGIRGRSNGGLLTAATMVQRPDLFGAVIVQVPVTDMLRYQHFTAGRYWTVEYGDSADPEAFRWLYAYSPYHNVAPGVQYPPTLVMTAEGDDRVVPMHALKFTAALQHTAGGASEQPLLLRVDTRSGHGLGKPTSKLIDEAADIYGFLLHTLNPGL